jgi:hypothetical protein
MSACEKCWRDAHTDPQVDGVERYRQLVKERNCTPEEQAGQEATQCPNCKRLSVHQITFECMSCGYWLSMHRQPSEARDLAIAAWSYLPWVVRQRATVARHHRAGG